MCIVRRRVMEHFIIITTMIMINNREHLPDTVLRGCNSRRGAGYQALM